MLIGYDVMLPPCLLALVGGLNWLPDVVSGEVLAAGPVTGILLPFMWLACGVIGSGIARKLVQKGVYQVFYRLSLIFAGCKVVLPLGQSLNFWRG